MTVVPLVLALSFGVFTQAPPPQPTTPAGCVKAARDFALTQQRAAKQITVEVVRKIEADKAVMARKCAAQFNVATVADADIADLIALYGESSQPDLAKAALDRALASKSLSAPVRANVLAQAVISGLQEPKSDVRNARLERYVDDLDKLPDEPSQERTPGEILALKVSTHARMNGFYRADDIDDGIIKHSTWLIDRAKQFTPPQRKTFGNTIVTAYVNMAEAVAGRGQNDRAKTLLMAAKTGWADVAAADRIVDPVMARYALVGTAAAPITAPRWLNAPPNTTITMPGAVTLLEFTAHWCGPCRESYPGVKRLLAKYGSKGFRVVLATELYGYFGADRPLTPEVEFERDREYWAHEGLNVPIAVGDATPVPTRGPDGAYVYAKNPNDAAYQVGAIPQIQIIDKQGRIRLIMVGYDDANEASLSALIEKLLKEK